MVGRECFSEISSFSGFCFAKQQERKRWKAWEPCQEMVVWLSFA
jgi:hypothetical protein